MCLRVKRLSAAGVCDGNTGDVRLRTLSSVLVVVLCLHSLTYITASGTRSAASRNHRRLGQDLRDSRTGGHGRH